VREASPPSPIAHSSAAGESQRGFLLGALKQFRFGFVLRNPVKALRVLKYFALGGTKRAGAD
jgi:hypothetical protein